MANDYRILDERDIKNFQAGNKLEVTEIGNKVTYEHIGEPPNTLPSKEKILEYGNSFNITVPSVYDSTGHVKSETKYSFIMPQETDTSNFLTTDNFLSESPIGVNKSGKNITYSHDEVSMTTIIPESATQLTYEGTFEIPALSAADGYGHATEQKTYKFQMPKAVDVSGYIKKDSFGSIDGNPVVKGENNKKQIAYSHKTLTPTSDNPTTVDLEYDKEFQFIALSATDGYGHANQNTTYKFKMPKAPTTSSINTSDFLKKADLGATFKAEDPLDVDITNNVVTYSHTGSSPSKNKTTSKSLAFGGTFDITVPSTYNSTGHVTATQPYTFTMPKITTKIITIGENTFSGDKIGSSYQWIASSLDIDIGSFTGLYVTLYPNATGTNIGSGYDSDDSKTMVNVRLLLPGSITFFAESPDQFNQVSFLIPRLYILTPTTNSYHGFSYTPTGWLKFIINFSTDHSTITSLTLTCDQQYVNPTFINKILITAY